MKNKENINYQKKLEEIVSSLEGTPKLLLHTCCAPCSSYCIEYLSAYFDITVLYYNPNISPVHEYEKRKQEQIRFLQEFHSINRLDFMDIDHYGEDFEYISKGLEQELEGGARCFKCYQLRLEKTAILGKENHYDFFGTTLTVSPYKNSWKINQIGSFLEEKYQIAYLYSDFKKKEGYKRSIELSKKYQLYRQDYCGCIYSKIEREKQKCLEIKI